MSWLDVLGWFGSAVLVLSLLQARVLRFRVVNTLGTLILLIFNALIAVWPMVGMNAVLLGINLWFIVRLTRERHDDQTFEVLQVGPDDPYLQRILTVEADDIAKFQPDATWQPAAARDHAFVILKGTEIVGVVLVDADGDLARVRLDYVVPRYRDFTPGEFLWRRSDFLRELGFRQVLSPEEMVGGYYAKVGFRRTERQFVLDL
jgi:hypothetical protein